MPDFLNATVQQYVDQLASGEPTPGGGSAAGLTGALGAALFAMSARFTVGREKYNQFQEAATAVLTIAEGIRAELMKLMEEDAAAYALYGSALALPKETDAQKAVRRQALQDATRASALAPLAIARQAINLLEYGEAMAANCNPNLVSDVVVGTHLALSAFQSAELNVRLNLRYLDDAQFVAEVGDELDAMAARAPQLAHAAVVTAYDVMNLPLGGE